MKASDVAKERLKSIQHRKDKLTESTSWSQPTVMKEQIDIYSVCLLYVHNMLIDMYSIAT